MPASATVRRLLDPSLSLKVTLMLAAVFASIIVVFVAFLLPFQREQHTRLLLQNQRLLSVLRDKHQRDLIHDLVGNNEDSLAIDLAALARQGDILWVQVVSGTRRLSATADADAIELLLGRPLPSDAAQGEPPVLLVRGTNKADLLGAGGQRLLTDVTIGQFTMPTLSGTELAQAEVLEIPWQGATALYSSAPLSAAEETYGRLTLLYSLAEENRNERHTRTLFYGILAATFVILVLLLNLLLARLVIGPVRRIMGAMRQASKGQLDVRLPVHSRDEIGSMAESFNTMVGELEVTKREIEDYSRNLEHMVTERTHALRQSQEQLTEVKNHLATIIANVATGVISLDEEGRVNTFNLRAGELLGLDAEETVGQPIERLLAGSDGARLLELISAVLSGGASPRQGQYKLKLAQGSRTLSVVASALVGEGSGRLGVVVVLDDLTQILATQRLEAWKEAVERVIHEIKNPLTPVGLAAQTLRSAFAHDRGRLEEIFPSATQMILDSVRDLKSLIAEFTQFSRLPEVVLSPQDADVILRDVVGMYADMAEPRLRYVPPAVPVTIEADEAQLRRVLLNVINNAVEAMESRVGEIVVEVAEPSPAGFVTISVRDQGYGVEDVERIFEPYFTTKVKGTGLGLAIARQIVEEHGGSIAAESRIGLGTVVRIQLPVAPLSRAPVPAKPS
jgi:PAS domain S-box-containing protein